MRNGLATVAIGLALILPSTVLGQRTELAVRSGDLIELRIGGAVRQAGFFDVSPTVTVSEALALAGGPTPQGREDRVWVFRDGEIIATILRGRTRIADSPIRSGDHLFVTRVSAVPERGWISRNAHAFSAMLGGAAGVAIALVR